ncbi:tubulin delta chain [Plasmodium falciparum NF54]|uniref:Tubulin delta chain n=2 Tax=Plasmodium falciparum TaxID=5833 RepID=Q8I2I0_PLAF7|nr:tubulin delta chain, putative [Plasmodium falciparum 3D7]KAF4330550.1 tubulin delta chain [Plasmodium falciparum NF54]PKC44976.1 tubulin delta chain [Plasmodium falciparum NF54]CAD52013.1 tubulin delta chain, putative [Plasmodium falciparum 3D7]|eukprot:XP_001352203.1 delta tubulin, putative [Plasmodium falciparum 3D7]
MMGVLSIQIGQCGNQVGYEFFDILHKYISCSKNEYFKSKLTTMYFDEEYKYGKNLLPIVEYEENEGNRNYMNVNNNIMCLNNLIARCILIDMEPKVIERCLSLNNNYDDCIKRKVQKKEKYQKIVKCNSEKSVGKKKYDDSDECCLQYVCGLDDYYESKNNFLKIFKRNNNNNNNNDHHHDNDGEEYNIYAKSKHNNNNNNNNINNILFKKSLYNNNILFKKSLYNNNDILKDDKLNGNNNLYNSYKNADHEENNNLVKTNFCSSSYFTNEWKFNKSNFICGLNGSGNNWAYGFYVHGKNICEDFINIINKEFEKNESKESIDNILLFHSLAGGSGSGLSSYISYILKDEYPKTNIFNICILPYMFGEISVQSLNTILCLCSLYDCSDGLILIENDKFELMCKRINNDENINLEEINKYISLFIAYNIGFPIDLSNSNYNNNCNYCNIMNYIVSDLCCHPNYKLLSTRYLPQVFKENIIFEQNSFNMLIKRMHRMLIKGTILDSNNICTNVMKKITNDISCNYIDNYYINRLSSRNILKNKNIFYKQNSFHIPIHMNEINSNSYIDQHDNSVYLKKKKKKKNYYNCIQKTSKNQNNQDNILYQHKNNYHKTDEYNHYTHNNVILNSKMIMRGEINENIDLHLFKNHVLYNNKSLNPLEIYIDQNKQFTNNSISMISNCLTPIPTLTHILEKAKLLYSTNAYIYQYNNYGVTHDQIYNSLMYVEQIINSYESLSSE